MKVPGTSHESDVETERMKKTIEQLQDFEPCNALGLWLRASVDVPFISMESESRRLTTAPVVEMDPTEMNDVPKDFTAT